MAAFADPAQPYSYDKDRGYVCALSALIIKATTAHILHVGDSRIYRLRNGMLEQLTSDQRLVVSQEESYLSRALGIGPEVDIDYRALSIEQGDLFVLATDGVHEHAAASFIIDTVGQHPTDLDTAARLIAQDAYAQGSEDNLTVRLVRIDSLPEPAANPVYQQWAELPPAPCWNPGWSSTATASFARSWQQPQPYLFGKERRHGRAGRPQRRRHRKS